MALADEISTTTQVYWIHNNGPRPIAGFMWDIMDMLEQDGQVQIGQSRLPVVRTWRQFMQATSIVPKALRLPIVHAQYGSLVGLISAFSSGHHHIISLRGSDVYHYGTNLKQQFGSFARIFMTYVAMLRADRIIVMSRAMQCKVRHWPFMATRQIHVLCDPAGIEFWQQSPKLTMANLRSRPYSLLTVSLNNANPIKRVYLVQRAVQLCQAAGMAVTIKSISGLGREAVANQMMNIDAIVLPSRHEGFPNAIKEALLMDKPFIATDVSDLRHYIRVRQGGLIVAPNELDIAFAIVDLVAADVLGLTVSDRALAQFHTAACGLKHLLLYRAFQ